MLVCIHSQDSHSIQDMPTPESLPSDKLRPNSGRPPETKLYVRLRCQKGGLQPRERSAHIELAETLGAGLLTSHQSILTTHSRVSAKARGLSRAFRRYQEPWQSLKSPSVLPSTLIAGIFLDRLFFSATKGPFFDNIFFLWFGSHMSLSYNNMSKISPVIFCERTRVQNP
jgi:hypothetical protein